MMRVRTSCVFMIWCCQIHHWRQSLWIFLKTKIILKIPSNATTVAVMDVQIATKEDGLGQKLILVEDSVTKMIVITPFHLLR